MTLNTHLNFNHIESLFHNQLNFDEFVRRAEEKWKFTNSISEQNLKIITWVEIIKDDLKNGRITIKTHKLVQELAKIILSEEVKREFFREAPAAMYQTYALLSEQFYRWGDSKNAIICVQSRENEFINGKDILLAISDYNNLKTSSPLIFNDTRITKEQVRFCLAYIQSTVYKASNYEKPLINLESCKKFIENFKDKQNQKSQNENDEWLGTLGSIEGHLGRCYRNQLDPRAKNCLGKSIKHYERRLNYRVQNDYQKLQEKSLIQNKMALTLIVGYAWIDIQQGQYRNGLFNSLSPARALLAGMDDQLAKCYLELLEVTAQRGLSLPKYFPQKKITTDPEFEADDVLEKAKKVFREFERLKVPKFTIRAKYELAMCYIYSKDWYSASKLIDEIYADKNLMDDRFWGIKSRLLKARVIALRKHYENKETSLSKVLNELTEVAPFIVEYKQAELEYYLVLGELYLSWGELHLAALNFKEVRRNNRNKKFENDSEPLNFKLEARCLLRLAEIDLLNGEASLAEDKIFYWEQNLSKKVDDIYLHNLAVINKKGIEEQNKKELIIKIKSLADLDYETQKKKLRQFLFIQAIRESEKEEASNSPANELLGLKKSTYYAWLKELKIINRGSAEVEK